MVEGQVGQRFAVQPDALLVERVDEPAVREAFHPGGGVDPRDPQATVAAFFEFAVAEGVLPAFFDGVFRYGVHLGASAEVAAGGLHDFFPARTAGRVVCCSWHVCEIF